MPEGYYTRRRTLSESIARSGVGLHTGEKSRVTLEPAEPGRGLSFVREDLDDPVTFEPRADRVADVPRRTALRSGDHTLNTVEHVLSALYGLGITEAVVRVEGPELPALDGSARPFVEALREAGIEELEGAREPYRVQEPIYVQREGTSLIMLPGPGLKISCTVNWPGRSVEDQCLTYRLDPETYAEEIAPARTFGFEDELEDLLEADLAQGGDLDNALIVGEDGGYLGEGPRLEDELVRHKILDLIGDLALGGTPVAAHVVALRPGHALNHQLVERLGGSVEDRRPARGESPEHLEEGFGIDRITEVLPHRYPFLLVDRIVSVDYETNRAVGYKNVTTNESFFQGHFPGNPVMPGVLILEAMAQTGAACILQKPMYDGKTLYFMGADDVQWRRMVRPGDRLVFEVEGLRLRSRFGKFEGVARVDGEPAAEAVLTYAAVEE